jgi:hypothetical protein
MQNRDKGRSQEDKSRSEHSSNEGMRGNRKPSDVDRSYQDRSPRTPESEHSDDERSSSVGRRHITGEGESIDKSDLDRESGSDIEGDGSRSGSRRDFRGNGREE